MLKWLTGWITDLLTAVMFVTVLMGYVAWVYPEHFPQHLVRYWPVAKVNSAHTVAAPAALAAEQVSAVTQVQR